MKKKILICTFLKITLFSVFAQQPDLNFSFEKLNTNRQVVGWSGYRYIVIVQDAFEGKNAAQIFTNYINLPDKLVLGEEYDQESRGVPFKEKPKGLKGFYKYEYGDNCNGKDSAEIYVHLRRYNNVSNKSDTIGRGQLYLGPSASYKLFEVPILYNTSGEPDTLAIEFLSQQFDKTVVCGVPNNRYFTIDNLSLEYTTPTTEAPNLKSPIKIYPNPVHNTLQLSWGENSVNQLIIKDTMGRILHKIAANTEGVTLDTSTWAAGIYFIEFINSSKEVLTVQKVVKQ